MEREGILALIGGTPVVELRTFDVGRCKLFVKLENQNPGGSIKDRIGLSMIEAAEREGKIGPGSTIIEATAGNTGLGLALVASQKGYKLTLVVPDKMSREKIRHLDALGAQIVITRSDVNKGHPAYYQDLAAKIAEDTPDSYYVNQFANPANAFAHETTTGPEIWQQLDGKVDAVVCGVGSGGTLTGLTKFFRETAPAVEMVLADPEGSILTEYVKTGKMTQAGSWMVEGIGEDFLPPLCDLSGVAHAYTISDQESFAVARRLLKDEGILAGSSSGTLVAAAVRYCKEQTTPKHVVTFICDSGNKYLSKMFDEFWMRDQGFLRIKEFGDLRDLISRKYTEGAVISISSDEPLAVAYSRMKFYDVSQLPVLVGDQVVGILDETDMLVSLYTDSHTLDRPVRDCMITDLRTVHPHAPLQAAINLLEQGYVPIVADEKHFYGLITRGDVLGYLRRLLKGQSHPVWLAEQVPALAPERKDMRSFGEKPRPQAPGFSTRAIHAGQTPAPAFSPLASPVYLTSTFVQTSPGVHQGYDYGRTGNPTRTALEENLASLEEGYFAITFSTGMAAADAVLHLLSAGDHVICGSDCFGGTYRLFEKVYNRAGLTFSFVDLSVPGSVETALNEKSKLVWLESPSNPMLKICDIREVCRVAHAHELIVVVDNTLASPYLQSPLSLEADLVLHSSTKYLSGHADVMGGVLVTNDQELASRLRFLQNAVGAVPSPLDCFLLLRSTKTLALRMEQHCRSALIVAQFLSAHGKVERLIYPGLPSHPQHSLALKQMRSGGGMLTVDLGDGKRSAELIRRLKLFTLAEGLGGAQSLVEQPALMSQTSVSDALLAQRGIHTGIIRLSVGLEDVDDLLMDLEQALAG